MSTTIKTPELPESVSEATLLTWHVSAGGLVRRDDKLADVETDKIVLEVHSPADGVLEPLVKEGEVIRRGDVIARVGAAGEAETKEPASEVKPAPAPAATPVASEPRGVANQDEVPNAEAVAGLSPSVRKMLLENDVPVDRIQGTGKGGRITRRDVERYLEETPRLKTNIGLGEATAAGVVPEAPKTPAPAQLADPFARRVPMSQIRNRIATRLKEVQNTAALLTTFNEVNMLPVMEIRRKYKDRFEKDYGVKLGLMSFFVKASVEALKKFPVVNASLDGRDIVYHEAYHVGIAVDSPRGLVVPVLRHAEHMNFAEIEKTIRVLAEKARDAKLAYEDLVGGTFTITNGGVFGSMLSTPIVNAPQSAILGMHTIQDRAWVEDGQVVVRPVMYLALTYDHRLVDGRDAVQFLVSIKQSLEDPNQLLLQL